jgi:hypothetical protein
MIAVQWVRGLFARRETAFGLSVDQVTNSNPHVVQPFVGKICRDGQPERRMYNTDRIDVSPTPERFAEYETTKECQKSEEWTRKVRGSIKSRRHKNRAAASKNRLESHEENRLQNELLH